MNIIMLGGPLVYCALLFSFDFCLAGSTIYVYMSDLVGISIAARLHNCLGHGHHHLHLDSAC
jgi:hypothetical protein